MNKIKYNDKVFNIVDIINLEGSFHLIIANGNEVYYVNKDGDNYYEARENLEVDPNDEKNILDVRKEHLLRLLIGYIKENELYDRINDVTALFKEYTKTPYVVTFLCWPFIAQSEFDDIIDELKKDMDKFMKEKLKAKSKEEKFVIVDMGDSNKYKTCFTTYKSEWVIDPSSKTPKK